MDIKLNQDGSYRISGLIQTVSDTTSYALSLAQYSKTNYSLFHIATDVSDCMDRIKSNLSDYGVGIFTLYGSGSYKVPVIEQAGTITIFTGYEVTKYQATTDLTNYTLLRNCKLYEPETYLAILLFLTAISLALTCKTCVNSFKMKHLHPTWRSKRGKKLFSKLLFKSLLNMIHRDGRSVRLIALTFHLGMFLILIPFLLLFKTTQVLKVEPDLITSFREIMARNSSIYYTHISMDESNMLQPNLKVSKGRDVGVEFWHYWRRMRIKLEAKDLARYVQNLKKMAKKVVDKEVVYLDNSISSDLIRSILCILSDEPDLYQIFTFRESSTRELIAGWGASLFYENKRLMDKKKISIENAINMFDSVRLPTYEMSMIAKDGHSVKQKEICMHGIDTEYNLVTQNSGVHFFFSFFVILLSLLVTCFFTLALEWLLKRKKVNFRR